MFHFNAIWVVFLLASVIQLMYWGIGFMRLRRYLSRKKINRENETKRSLSVVICARNEAENISNNLPAILNQDYPEFEVLVVNDGSTDETAVVLHKLQQEYAHLSVLHIGDKPADSIGKKYALERGIHAAASPWLVLTDADCQPISDQWLKAMDAGMAEGKLVGLGYGPYARRKGLLNKLIRFETVYTAIQYFSFALWGKPYMGVGRNLMYHKALFTESNGFSNHAHLASGDDDLFINTIATGANTATIIDVSAFVISTPELTFRKYVRQKSRHFTTSKHYRFSHAAMLFLLSLSHFLFYGGFFTLLVFDFRFTTFLFLIAVTRFIFLHLVYEVILHEFKEKDLHVWIPLLDFFYLLFILLLAPTLLLTNMRKWK
ncbi:MAG: glycosyltransferase [Bacteroidota bacterium]